MYLLSLKAEKFPVECYGIEQAKLLQKFAGLENGKFKSVQELIPSTSY
ncbi:plasmid fertility inhibition factor family protein [Anaerosinus sp.]